MGSAALRGVPVRGRVRGRAAGATGGDGAVVVLRLRVQCRSQEGSLRAPPAAPSSCSACFPRCFPPAFALLLCSDCFSSAMRTWWGGNKRLTFSWARCTVWSFCRVRSAHPRLPVTVGRWGNRARGGRGRACPTARASVTVPSLCWPLAGCHHSCTGTCGRECTDPQLCCTSPTAQPSHQLSPGGGWWHRRRTVSPSHAPSSCCRDLCRGEGAGVVTHWYHPLSPLKPQPQTVPQPAPARGSRLRGGWTPPHGWPGRFTRCRLPRGHHRVSESSRARARTGTEPRLPRHGCARARPSLAPLLSAGVGTRPGCRRSLIPWWPVGSLHGAARRGLCTGPGLGQGAGALAAAHSPPAPVSLLGLSSVSFLTQGSCGAPGRR